MSLSPQVPLDVQLDTTLVVMSKDGEGPSKEVRDAVIKALIDQLDGVQDPALGTVVIPVPVEGFEGLTIQLWIHDWE